MLQLGGKIAHATQDPGDADSGFGRLVHDDEALHHNEVAERVAERVQLVAQMTDRPGVGKGSVRARSWRAGGAPDG